MNDLIDETYMRLAVRYATYSTDPSTQNGAVIHTSHGGWIYGYNDWPEGVKGTWERPAKYDYVEHAERASIYAAALNGHVTSEATMYCPWAACADCARAIVLSGIKMLVRLPFRDDDIAQGSRWGKTCEIGDQIMTEGGVKIREIELDSPVGIKILRDGKLLSL